MLTDEFLNGTDPETTLCFFNTPILKDDNENLIINEINENCKGARDIVQSSHRSCNSNANVPNGIASTDELNDQPHIEEIHDLQPQTSESEIPTDIHEENMVNGHISESDDSTEVKKPQDVLVNGDIAENRDPVPSDKKSPDALDSPKEEPVSSPPPKGKSWASLFSGAQKPTSKLSKPALVVKTEQTAVATNEASTKDNLQNKKKLGGGTVTNGSNAKSPQATEVVDVEDDLFSRQIADQISKNEIVYKSPGLMPRGFINSSNWCYINATLQALLTSSPFCHLMRSLPSRQPSADANVMITSTPILDSFVRLVKELKPLPKKGFQRAGKDQFQGTSYEPEYIYKMLSTIKSKFSEKGRQEDAEEFLSCVLNGLHEEMLKVCEFHFGKNLPTHGSDEPSPRTSQSELGYEVPVHDEEHADDSNEENDQWEEVTATRKNRGSVTRRADISKTPVSDVFRGELRSDLFQEGLKATATLEPFFTLPLDINDQKPRWSVNEALDHLTRLETVQDFTNTKTKVKGEATRKISLETLPPVLILHLKRFIYDKEGGSLKIDKEVQYHTDLVIGKELLSKSSKKLSQEKRTYKLFAVVYHHGKAVTGGHYTTDVYHDGLNCWLRIDDQAIKMSKVHDVVRHDPQRTAYLLYYKRTDLMAV